MVKNIYIKAFIQKHFHYPNSFPGDYIKNFLFFPENNGETMEEISAGE